MVPRGLFCLVFVRSVLSLRGWPVMLTKAIRASSNCCIKNVPSAWGWAQRWTLNRGNWENIVWLPNTPKYSFFIAVIHHFFWALCQYSNFQQLLSRDLTALFSSVMLKWLCYDQYEKCRAGKLASETLVLQIIISANLERKKENKKTHPKQILTV